MTEASGQIQAVTLHSQALCKTMRLLVYLPPHYGEFGMRYPVAYLLHRWGGDERYWVDSLHLPEVADRLIHAGAIPPFVAVMPQGDKSFFLNAADPGGDFTPILRLDPDTYRDALSGYGDYADYLMDDVIPEVEWRYEVRSDRAGRVIAGVSMGGAGAAALAFTQPECFGAVGIHSTELFSSERLGQPWIFGLGDPAAFARRDPLHLAWALEAESGLRIYLDCGQQDEYARLTAEVHYALTGREIQHTYVSRPGGHDADYWRAHLAEYLGFYAAGW